MPKIIGFLGSHPADICMYAAYALQNTGKHVCVIDNSDDGVLFRCIPTPDERLTAVTFHNVDFMRLEPLVQWHELDYDFLLVQLGTQPQELCLALCSERVLVIDCERRNLDFYNEFMQQSGIPMSVLLRGFCPDGAMAGRIREYFGQGNRLIEKWLFLPLDEADEAYRIGMQYGLLSKFAHISEGMERVLMQLLRMLGTGSRGGIVRAVRDAKNGRSSSLGRQAQMGHRLFHGFLHTSGQVV